MSRIGKLPVPVPASVEVTIDGQKVSVKGPKGSLEHTLPEEVTISREEDGALKIDRVDDGRDARAAHGISRTDRKSTRLNSSHVSISYAVFCLKKKSDQHAKLAKTRSTRG